MTDGAGWKAGSAVSVRENKGLRAFARNPLFFLAGGLGFEPRLAESESAVLPLDDPPISETVAHK